jgi:hypothetical protein
LNRLELKTVRELFSDNKGPQAWLGLRACYDSKPPIWISLCSCAFAARQEEARLIFASPLNFHVKLAIRSCCM